VRSHTGGFLEGAREMTGRESARQALASRERSRRWPWSELAYGKAASVGGLFRMSPVGPSRHFAALRKLVAMGIADVEYAISIYENASSADVLPTLQLQPRIFSHQISSIEAVARARHFAVCPKGPGKRRGAHKKERPRAS
jgi:hypothetical protein